MRELLYCYGVYYKNQMMQYVAEQFHEKRWARKIIGGRWERWYFDFPGCCDLWIQWDSRKRGNPCLGRGRPTVEDYTR